MGTSWAYTYESPLIGNTMGVPSRESYGLALRRRRGSPGKTQWAEASRRGPVGAQRRGGVYLWVRDCRFIQQTVLACWIVAPNQGSSASVAPKQGSSASSATLSVRGRQMPSWNRTKCAKIYLVKRKTKKGATWDITTAASAIKGQAINMSSHARIVVILNMRLVKRV